MRGTPPNTVEGFRRFARWARRERRRGVHLTFAVVPAGCRQPCGIIQIWPIERDFSTAEWGVVVGDQHWGRGIVVQAAQLLFEFAFATLGVCRLEGRAVDGHERAHAVLRKLGATAEGRLREGFRSNGVVRDYVMWSILASEWQARQGVDTVRTI